MKLQNLKKSELFRNISTLISGTVIAQLIPILLQPVLRRYYAPEVFGAYAVYSSLIGILIIISSFKYELAIILPKKGKEAVNIVLLTQLLNLLFNLVIFFFIIIFNHKIQSLLNLPAKYVIFLYLVPAGTFLSNLYQSINYWLIRQKAFFSVSLNKFVRRGTEGSFQVLFKWIGASSGLIFGDIIGHLANNISGLIQAVRKEFRFGDLSITKLKYVAKKYVEYPKYNLLTSFMSACSYLLPAIFINKFFSSEVTGYYDLSKLVLSIPLALIAVSISNVLMQRVAERYKMQESIKKDLFQIFIVILIIALAEILVVTIFGEELFRLIFGKQWALSGKISKILVWSYAINFLATSFWSIFIAMKKIKILSFWQIFYFSGILSLILFKRSEFIHFIKIYVVIEITCYLLISIIIFKIITDYELKIAKQDKFQ